MAFFTTNRYTHLITSLCKRLPVSIVGILFILLASAPLKADSCRLMIARVMGHNYLGNPLTEEESKKIKDMITFGVNKDLIEKYTYDLEEGEHPNEDQPTWSRKVALDSDRVEPENVNYIWNNVRNIILEAGGKDLNELLLPFSLINNEWTVMRGYLAFGAPPAVKAKLPEILKEMAPMKLLADKLVTLAKNTYPNAKVFANLHLTPDAVIDSNWHEHPKTVTMIAQLKKGGKMTRLNNPMKPEHGDLIAVIGPHAPAAIGSSDPRVVLVVFIEI